MGKMNWEKANQRDKTGPAKSSYPFKGTKKQRALIKALTTELGYTGREKQDLWGRVGVTQTPSEVIDELIAAKRALRAPEAAHMAAIRDEISVA